MVSLKWMSKTNMSMMTRSIVPKRITCHTDDEEFLPMIVQPPCFLSTIDQWIWATTRMMSSQWIPYVHWMLAQRLIAFPFGMMSSQWSVGVWSTNVVAFVTMCSQWMSYLHRPTTFFSDAADPFELYANDQCTMPKRDWIVVDDQRNGTTNCWVYYSTITNQLPDICSTNETSRQTDWRRMEPPTGSTCWFIVQWIHSMWLLDAADWLRPYDFDDDQFFRENSQFMLSITNSIYHGLAVLRFRTLSLYRVSKTSIRYRWSNDRFHGVVCRRHPSDANKPMTTRGSHIRSISCQRPICTAADIFVSPMT